MLNKKKNRKSQGLVEVFSWFMAVFFTILFFILFNLPSCQGPPEQKIVGENLNHLKLNYDLGAYLRTPMTYSGAWLTAADFIVLAMENESMKNDVATVPNHPLKFTADTLMRTYEGYIMDLVKKGYICSLELVAKTAADEIVLYSSLSKGYGTRICAFEHVITEAKIPGTSRIPITVEIRTTTLNIISLILPTFY